MVEESTSNEEIAVKQQGNEGAVAAEGCCASTKQFFLYDNHRRDVQAFYFNQFGRSILFISFMFLSLGVLEFANQQAGCPQNENGSYQNCDNKVYGMQASSILSLMAIIGGLSTSVFMPYAGAVVDYSDHRLGFGRFCAALLTLVNFVQIFIYENTWYAMVILQSIIAAATFMANSMVMWSYVSAPNDHDLHGITASGRVWETFGMLSFFVVVGGVQIGTGWDSISLARFSQALATGVGGINLFFAYTRYSPVKAVKFLEEGSNLYVAGLSELKTTMTSLNKNEPAAARFLLGSVFIEAAISAFTNLAITYLSMQIEMSSTAITIFIVVVLACNPFGVIVHRSLSRKIGHKRSYVSCIGFTTIITALLIGTVYTPDDDKITFIFAILFGISFGWYYPCSNGFFVSLVPEEKVTELWGFNSFCSVILSWVPPMIFAALNESTGNLRVGLTGMIMFLSIGFVIALTIPNNNATGPGNDTAGKDDVELANADDQLAKKAGENVHESIRSA